MFSRDHDIELANENLTKAIKEVESLFEWGQIDYATYEEKIELLVAYKNFLTLGMVVSIKPNWLKEGF